MSDVFVFYLFVCLFVCLYLRKYTNVLGTTSSWGLQVHCNVTFLLIAITIPHTSVSSLYCFSPHCSRGKGKASLARAASQLKGEAGSPQRAPRKRRKTDDDEENDPPKRMGKKASAAAAVAAAMSKSADGDEDGGEEDGEEGGEGEGGSDETPLQKKVSQQWSSDLLLLSYHAVYEVV